MGQGKSQLLFISLHFAQFQHNLKHTIKERDFFYLIWLENTDIDNLRKKKKKKNPPFLVMVVWKMTKHIWYDWIGRSGLILLDFLPF